MIAFFVSDERGVSFLAEKRMRVRIVEWEDLPGGIYPRHARVLPL